MLPATGFSKRITARIIKWEKDVDTGMWVSFSTSEKACPKKKIVAVVHKFDDEVIRRLIYNFHATEKQCTALNTLLPLICEHTSFKRGKMSSRILWKKLQFRYLKHIVTCSTTAMVKYWVAMKNIIFQLQNIHKLAKEKFSFILKKSGCQVCKHAQEVEDMNIQINTLWTTLLRKR